MQFSTTLYIIYLISAALVSAIPYPPNGSHRNDQEYVKACDSGPDDVTNQCINRIPEDIGVSQGKHACAYHEAEVKCLGLCGNTLTWKIAYSNALKRYRLVCASYINDRLMAKDDDEANGKGINNDDENEETKPRKTISHPAKKHSAKDDSSSNDDVDDEATPSKKYSPKPKDKDNKSQASTKKQDNKKPNVSTSANKSKPFATSATTRMNIGIDLDKLKSSSSDNDKEDKDKAHALLPTMDPELAHASHTAHAITLVSTLVVILTALTI